MATYLTPIPSAPPGCPSTVEELVAELMDSLMFHLRARLALRPGDVAVAA